MIRALVAGLLLGLAAAPASYGPQLNARLFDTVWQEVADSYWNRALDPTWVAARSAYRAQAIAAPNGRALYAVLDRMLATVGDSHVFVTPPLQARWAEERQAGVSHVGFGFSAWEQDGRWLVYAVQPQTPAATAGVEVGWELVAINGRPLDPDWRPRAAEDAAITFADEDGRRHLLTLAGAELVPIPPRRATRLADGSLLLALDGFTGGEARWVRQQIGKVPDATAVILDLRENGGGEGEAAARLAGCFFLERRPLMRRIGRGGTDEVPVEGAGRSAFTGPLAILVGPRSASAAEAIAALVEESGRGITVGERTAGALTGAALVPLPDGGELSVAVYDIRTGAGRRLEGTGFTPRIRVATTRADRRQGRDAVLLRAQRALREEW